MNHHRVLKRIFWIARTGLPWRDLRAQFGQWSSVYRQFRHWTLAPLGEQIPEALSKSGQVPAARQIVDSLSVRADQQREAAKAGLRDRALAVREVALRQRTLSASRACEFPRRSRSRRSRHSTISASLWSCPTTFPSRASSWRSVDTGWSSPGASPAGRMNGPRVVIL